MWPSYRYHKKGNKRESNLNVEVPSKMFPEEEMQFDQCLEGHTSDITWCDFSGQMLASASNDKTVRLYRRNSDGIYEENPLSPLEGHRYGVYCVRFSPFGTVLASSSIDGSTILWNTQTGEQLATLQHPSEAAIRVCCFSPSSALLATGSDDESAIIWDLSTRSIIRVLEGHEAMISALSFTPDSNFLVTGSSAGDLKLWDARYGHGKCLATQPEAHDLGVLGCDFSPHFQNAAGAVHMTTAYIFASCGNDDLVKVWQIKTGMVCSFGQLLTLEGHSGNVMCCAFSKDGSLLASGSGDHSIIIWDPFSGNQLQRLEKHERYVTSVCFSSDGQNLASGSNDKTVILWSTEGGKHKAPEKDPDEEEEETEENTTPAALPVISNPGITIVGRWGVDEVCNWLEQVGVRDQYEDIFRNHAVDGQELLHLTHESLNNNLHIEAMGHRNKILRAVQALKNPLWAHSALNMDDGNLPEEFYCPITHELMKEPVVAADGYTYESAAINEWLESGKTTSPMTNEPLDHSILIPNRALNLLLQKYLA